MIQLTVSQDEEGMNPARNYSYAELLDLQSRLMLVAGQAEKGKEDVDRFITVSIASLSLSGVEVTHSHPLGSTCKGVGYCS